MAFQSGDRSVLENLLILGFALLVGIQAGAKDPPKFGCLEIFVLMLRKRIVLIFTNRFFGGYKSWTTKREPNPVRQAPNFGVHR